MSLIATVSRDAGAGQEFVMIGVPSLDQMGAVQVAITACRRGDYGAFADVKGHREEFFADAVLPRLPREAGRVAGVGERPRRPAAQDEVAEADNRRSPPWPSQDRWGGLTSTHHYGVFLFWCINTPLTPWITAHNPPQGFGQTNDNASFFYHLSRVLTTTWRILAIPIRKPPLGPKGVVGRKKFLINKNRI